MKTLKTLFLGSFIFSAILISSCGGDNGGGGDEASNACPEVTGSLDDITLTD